MPKAISNDVSAIQPEIWSAMVQVPLYKSLVAMEVANTRLMSELQRGDVIHVPRFGSLSAQTYTPGTEISATAQEWDYDTLTVSTYKHCSFYVDDLRKVTMNIDQARELATESAYQLKDKVDAFVFGKMVTPAAGGTRGFYCASNADLGVGATANRPLSAGSANIINIFAGARQVLRNLNTEESVPWCAVITPKIAQFLETKAASSGFNVADSTLRNGYAGDFMGFEVYISKNLPSGKCSAIAFATATYEGTTVDWGGISGGPISATSCKNIYFGQKGTIDLVMLKEPTLEIRKVSDMIGHNFITYTLYGATICEKNRKRGIQVPVQSSFY